MPSLEMWAGVECTINRVGNSYRDQLLMSGHYERATDIDQLVSLGVRSVRYPVLLERHASDSSAWQATDSALERFRKASIEPIIGLMHHGSGTTPDSLLDPGYPEQLARFAAVVAQRYPWVRKFTPVNEPLTTARFAALYGFWYPHHHSDTSFVSAVLNQTLAIQQSMRAIRAVTPDATLVATEDLGFTHATEQLQYQAAFENERRWLTWDLLLGRVGRLHPLWKYLTKNGGGAKLRAILSHADESSGHSLLIGINHYLTSERYLDSALHNYPTTTHGGNGRHSYADVEAVRVIANGPLGIGKLLSQTWSRYGLPIAITEAHLGCTREQQMQWLAEVWRAAMNARSAGADVRAVTAWAAFGSFDWNSLLTRNDGVYESGLFDLRGPAPRATALATMVKSLSTTATFDHPALHASPWWRSESRLHYRPLSLVGTHATRPASGITHEASASSVMVKASRFAGRPILVTGASGTLGYALVRTASERGLPCRGVARTELDITDSRQIDRWLDLLKPWAVVNAAGWVRVDDAERDPGGCVRTNASGAALLASACSARDIRFVNFSSDLVFAGDGHTPLVESDTTAPINVYGHSRDEGERRVRLSAPGSLVVRTGAFFGDWDDFNFLSRSLATLKSGKRVQAPGDTTVSATYVTDLVNAVYDLLLDGESGTWHLANHGAMNWTDLARLAADMAGFDSRRIDTCLGVDIGWTAPRPRYSVLGSERGCMLPNVEHALARWIACRAWERMA